MFIVGNFAFHTACPLPLAEHSNGERGMLLWPPCFRARLKGQAGISRVGYLEIGWLQFLALSFTLALAL